VAGKPKSYRAALVQKVHTGWKWKEIYKEDRALYEQFLVERYGAATFPDGKISSTALSNAQLRDLADFMRGVERKSPPNPNVEAARKPAGVSDAQWRHIRFLQRELRWDDSNLRGYVQKVAKVSHERFLTVALARNVIAGMKQYANFRATGRKRG
jgi:hypothetical protein